MTLQQIPGRVQKRETAPGDGGSIPRHSLQIAIILLATAIVGYAVSLALPVPMALAAALSVFCIGLWATALVPEYWPALAFFVVAAISGIAPPQTIFSGFSSSTFWLLFSGAVMGASIRHTGLGKRAATMLSSILGDRYKGVIAGIVFFSVALSFVMPSGMGRIVLLLPITVAIAEHLGYDAGSNGRTGMLMAAAFGAFLPSFSILPSNAPNMILAGMVESLYGQHISYWNYLVLHFPVLGFLKSLILIALILWMFPDRDPPSRPEAADTTEAAGVMTSTERRLAMVVALSLALWITDSIHHISPAWVGLAGALYCLWPHSGLTSKKCFNEDINYGSLFFVAGVVGLGAVISSTGLGQAVVAALSDHAAFSVDQPLWNVSALSVIATLVSIVTNLAGVPAVMTPMAQDLSTLTGLPLTTVLMTQVLAFSNVFLPYQAPPLIFALQSANLSVRAVTKLCLALFFISAFILTPLEFVWWYVLGFL
jgi:anion transporter